MKIDQWLWAAGLFRNRGLAQAAADGGKVKVGGERVKAVHEVKPGDQLEIATGEFTLEVTVLALEGPQGPMDGADLLYEESEDSIARRAQAMEAKKLAASHSRHPDPGQHSRAPGGGGGSGRPGHPGRPGQPGRRGKNQRRQSEGFKRGRGR